MNKVTLYGKDKNDGLKQWSVWTVEDHLFIEHGKLKGKMQLKEEVVEGKNQGRSNETSGSQQAELEAQSRINKQIDRGYRADKEDLQEIPLLPMLASDYLKQGHRIKYPCAISPKLDGVRCLAIRHKDHVELKSRGGKPYAVQHLQSNLEAMMFEGEIWDGEIYYHGKYLEEITSAVKKVNDLTSHLSFIVFDVVDGENKFIDRLEQVDALRQSYAGEQYVKFLKYDIAHNEEDMKSLHKDYVSLGYEGAMIRNMIGVYESGKRSADLQKYKEFLDSEFKITGVLEDRNGNAVFQVWDDLAQAHFNVTYGDFEQRKYQLAHPDEFVGKWLTVKYQARFKDSKLVQFPTGVCIRDCNEEGEPLE